MFTGIIQAVGTVAAMEPRGGDLRLRIHTGKLDLGGYWADVSRETLRLTSLGNLSPGSRVNLEKSLTPSSRLGGHIVSGHVDGLGEVVSLEEEARSWRFVIRAPDALARYIAHKGSICVDGTSLTVNAVDGASFDLNIIPQTMAETVFGDYRPGSRVNLEVDVIARYLERLLQGDAAALPGGGLTMATLAENGYVS